MEQRINKIFILDIDKKYNIDVLPVTINDSEIIQKEHLKYDDDRYLRSQYSLEITLNNLFKNYNQLLTNYHDSDKMFL